MLFSIDLDSGAMLLVSQWYRITHPIPSIHPTLHGMLHPTIMYKNLFNLYSVKMSFVLFGTASQCCDATSILDGIIKLQLLSRWRRVEFCVVLLLVVLVPLVDLQTCISLRHFSSSPDPDLSPFSINKQQPGISLSN